MARTRQIARMSTGGTAPRYSRRSSNKKPFSIRRKKYDRWINLPSFEADDADSKEENADSKEYEENLYFQSGADTLIAVRREDTHGAPTTISIAELFRFEWEHKETLGHRIDLSSPTNVLQTDDGQFYFQFKDVVIVVQGARSLSLPITKSFMMHSEQQRGGALIHCISHDTHYIVDTASLCYTTHRIGVPLNRMMYYRMGTHQTGKITASAPNQQYIYLFENKPDGNKLDILRYNTAERSYNFLGSVPEMDVQHATSNADGTGIILFTERNATFYWFDTNSMSITKSTLSFNMPMQCRLQSMTYRGITSRQCKTLVRGWWRRNYDGKDKKFTYPMIIEMHIAYHLQEEVVVMKLKHSDKDYVCNLKEIRPVKIRPVKV